jgi:outer membrane lipoprotein-sorting protein
MSSGTKGSIESAALAVFLTIAGAALPAPAAPALSIDELMQMLASVESANAKFVETRHSALLKAPLVLQGTLAYRRPDRVEKHVLSPYDERITVESGRLTIENRTHKSKKSLAVSGAPGLAALIESIRATRAGDLPSLQRHYALQIEGSREHWTLTLKPLDAQVGDYVVAFALSGSGARIGQVIVEETSGDRSVMEIHEQPGR